MNKNTKRVLSAITVVSLSVTSFTGNIQNVVNAKEDKQEENALSTNRVNAEVLENEAGAVIRVSASSNVQNVKTTYSVDTAGSKVVSFGDLKAGEVREIQVNFEEDSNKLKSLPKTTAVSDRVDFNKEVRGHKIKGSVSFQYDNGDNAPTVTPTVPTTPTKPVVTPTVPTEPTKPVAPVVTTPSNPTAPTNPVVTPTEPAKPVTPVVTPVEPTKPVTPAKPLQPVIPDTPDEPVVTPEKPGRPVAPVVTPAEPTKPVEPAKPLQPVIPDTPDEPVVTPEKPAKPVAPVVTPAEPTKPVVTPTEPAKPVTPAVTPAEPAKPVATPADTGLEAGMPANAKWSRAQLKEWGFTFGKITGDYRVDGDLGVFDNDDALDPAFRSGIRTIDSKIIDGTMSFADAEKNTPHGYAWNSVTKPDGTRGYAMHLYGTDGKFNDGQKAR